MLLVNHGMVDRWNRSPLRLGESSGTVPVAVPLRVGQRTPGLGATGQCYWLTAWHG
jgi:hypothetical protein